MGDDVGPKDLWDLGWKTGVVSFLALCFGGLALRAYSVLRFKEPTKLPEPTKLLDFDWLLSLVIFGLCGAVTIATLVVAWRLVHRKRSAPNWSMAFVLLCIVLFTLLVWPTPWTYREYGCQVFQINRFIGSRTPIAQLPSCDEKRKDAHPDTSN